MTDKSSQDLDALMQQFLDDELVEAAKEQAQPECSRARRQPQPSNADRQKQPGPAPVSAVDAATLRQTGSPDTANATPLQFRQEIAHIASTVLKIPPDRLDVRENMSRYGVDSIIVTEIMKRISDLLDLPIAPTVFFEARHLDELADILYQRYRKTIEKRLLNEDVQPVDMVSHDAGSVRSVGAADIGSAEIDSEVKSWISKFRASVGSHAPAVEETEYRETPENVRSSGETGYEPVAIIAMEGIFPDSANLQEFEKHLRDGDDCISEIPADRWDWQQVYGDPKQGEFTKVKYGGFAPDIDKFDPLFFGMSPREAELMDPQHRLFIQCVWKLIESAGYAPKPLSGRKIGLFMGINLQDYAHLIDRAGAMEALHLTSLGHMFCPNRLSFFLDIHGPSQVIDTACSSSLVALHRAVLSIQHEGCEMAIAGGANLLISPDMHIMYSKVGMICEDGRCKTFSGQANGYVRSDGVGAVLLKSLKRAERDGDTILAVIRGSAENHGGMSTSLTAPNPKAQASLIVEAHQKANIDPRSIGYIECHGTGTSLGDPIEINGLKMAFEQLHRSSGVAMPDTAYCGLGSVKSNIGHAETAAGIAGVIKAVLALRNKRLYRSLHCEAVNPMIELEQSPFFILQQGRPWQRSVIDGNEQPRRAGVSSFGAGGSNAHVVIEEYSEKPLPPVQRSAPALILLSAKNEARLGDVVENLLGFLNGMPESETPDIADIAFTLQVGREAMAERLAVIADSVAELKIKLSRMEAADCYKGTVKRNKALHEDDTLAPTLRQCFAEGDVRQLAELWAKGVNIDWQALYAETALAGRRPRRVTLPSYPFARQRYWLPETGGNRRIGQAPAQLHPLLHQNTSDLSEQRFSSVFSGNEFFLADHVVMGEKVLPGVAYLEMARAAIKQVSAEADGNPVNIRLKNVVWARPFVLGNQPTPLHIGLYPEQHNQIAYRIYSKTGDSVVLHSQGTAVVQAEPSSDAAVEKLDLSALREKMTERNSLDAKQCYDAFRVMGIAYGPGHQGLETVYYSAPESNAATPQVLAKLALPDCVEGEAAQFVLHPGLIDSGLQACIGLMAGSGHALPTGAASGASKTAASLPFALDELTLPAQPSATMWAWIRYADGSSPTGKVQKLNIDLCDEQGRICVRMKGFSSRTVEQKQPSETSDMLMCKPVWTDQAIAHDTDSLAWGQHLVVLCDLDRCFADSTEQDIAARILGASCTRLNLNSAIEDSYKDAAIQVFEMIKQAFARKTTGNTLLQVLVPGRGKGMLLGGLSGLLKTASRENARFFGQLIELDTGETGNGLAAKIIEGSRMSEQAQIRYSGRVPQVLSWQEADIATSSVVPWKDNGIYLITGGSGGLGLLFAKQIAQHAKNATVVLCGRSALSPQKQAQIDRLSSSGVNAEYRQLDVGRRQDVDDLVARLLDAHGRIDGILHCAGLLRDNFIQKKSAQEFTEVLAPKVAGTLHLDKATENIDLDFLALFSSAAGAWGSAGQADYAAANAFMDVFAAYRNEQVKDGQRRGHTLSINWPLWADGGMRMEASAEAMMQQTTGMVALPAENGIDAFNRIMASGAAQMMVMQGSPVRIRRLLVMPEKTVKKITPDRNDDIATGPQIDTGELQAKIRQMLLQAVAKLMKFEPDDLDADAEFSDYGFDSITLTDFSNRLNQQYQLELTPTIFFEYPTIADFADWLASEYPSVFAEAFGLQARPGQIRRGEADQEPLADPVETLFQPHARFANTETVAEPQKDADKAVAIIGISGRFPMANDLDQFWNNLLYGKDCISEIPEDRWDWRALYGDPATEANKTNIKWGGFIDGVGNFDARFFGISPREAELMDPQQRLLMQYVWKAIEDAGYSAASLSGSNTAIFIGTASSGYGELMAKSGSAIESYSSTGVVGSVGPNRMSYFLNLHGPSEPVETACSSSLVAIHRALAAIANGDCDQAIVGGINLIISPETQISFNKAGMLCEDGRCKTFSSQANGYVRGEGVGMLFLKKLTAAEQAGDHIYGVIRGSAENHGGRGNSLTAPNPKAQAELLKAAYARAGIDPRTVSYIEAHGTGTELGDPIEINGLKTAFRDLYQATGTPEIAAAHCGLGSVKTNIGHLELAAGVAGVIKVLLQLKHKTLVKSLHCDEVNPYIQLQDSPFYLVRDNRDWTPLRDRDGLELPRRAGVSSFGFGGVNAHIVIEEYRQGADAADAAEPEPPSLVLLSAKNQDRLKAYAEELLGFIEAGTVADNRNSGHARQVLSHTVRALVADILQTDPNEIEPTQALDDYGFDPVHRTMLLARLQQAFGLEIEAGAVLDNHSVAAMAAGVLEKHPVLHDRLNREAALESEQTSAEGEKQYGFRLADLAYTLQVGREPMEERFAVIAASIEELEDKLRAFIEGRTDAVNDLYLGQVKQHKHILAAFTADEELQEALEKWMQRGKFSKLLDMWVKGLNLDWEKLYGEAKPYSNKPRRISAPGYPFAEQRYWMEARAGSAPNQAGASAQLHPLVHQNVSTLQQVGFATALTGNEFFLADHRVQGQKVLPGVAYLEMARAAATIAAGREREPKTPFRLEDVVWLRPVVVNQPQSIGIELTAGADGAIGFQVFSQTATGGSAEPGRLVHSQGIVSFKPAVNPSRLDPGAMPAQAGMSRFDAAQCYPLFSALGLDYGPGHQGISELYAGNGQVLARLVLPESVQHTLDQYVLHPSLMDSALQASIGLGMTAETTAPSGERLKPALPFALETVDVFGACAGSMWAWVRRSNGSSAGDRVQKLDIDLCNDQGQVCVQIKGFSSRLLDTDGADSTAKPADTISPITGHKPSAPVDAAELRNQTIDYFKQLLSSTLKYPVSEIRTDESLDFYGIDSMMVMELTAALEKPFGPLSKTLFFEYQTLAELVDYFLEAQRSNLLKLFGADKPDVAVAALADHAPAQSVKTEFKPAPAANAATLTPAKPNAGALDIAVVGLSGRYPQARDIEEFWRNLRDGRNCITEVPDDRWDWHAYYSEDRSQPGRHSSKWGGFIADVDKFDPLFFNISPREAEYMDPQERLFLEHAWMAMEDAGYRREDLQKPLTGSLNDDDMPAQVGVYAGVMYGEYQLLGLEGSLSGKNTLSASFYASVANRVSYFLNLHGPSMTVDTMCSSSLTAIHLACQDLKLGRTDMALAGGVNISIHPNKYSILSTGQYISSRGQCESFGSGGDGYVPGEGVGVVVLKRLADAERDGDHIYGVIKSSALNHGGKTHGYSVPNPNAQQMAISRALREADIDPRAINYIEAHGTGTKLGDPIEITGLSKAFGKYTAPGYSCWIGSAKSNIGHAESAAGIAGLTKVLLQMREGRIAPSLHSETLNPNIDFSATPFQVNQQLREWQRPVIDGRIQHRTAGVSSYGAGGSNAHMVIEEYIGPESVVAARPSDAPCAFVLSAKTEQQLGQYAESLVQFVRRQSDANVELSLPDMAFTLQIGREAMQQRLGLIAGSAQELAEKLSRFLQGDYDGLYLGRARYSNQTESLAGQDHQTIAELLANWVKGAGVDWHQLYVGNARPPKRISLPTYPFARERYWLELPEKSRRPATAETVGSPAGNADTLMLYPVWKDQFARKTPVEAEYAERRILFSGPVIEIPGAVCLPLHSDSRETDSCFNDYAVQVFEQVKELLGRKPAGRVLLQIVTGTGDQSSGCPEPLLGALAAMLKTAQMENPQFTGQLIELDASGAMLQPAELAAMLHENGQIPADQHVRYSRGKRQVMTWAELDGVQQAMPVWKQGGVYLITGGAGGLGLIFAREIVRQVNDVSLILTGRSELDDARRASIEALQASGAKVEYRIVDVSDKQAVTGLVQSCESSLNGIIHSAGIIRDNFIFKKTATELQDVLAAKVSGVVNLDQASRSVNLDFFILFSSLAGAAGNPGQSDYATANAFMDAYAAYRNRLASKQSGQAGAMRPKGHTLSINWPLWQQGGMDIDPQSKEMMWRTVGLKPMQTQAGIDALYRSLASGKDRVMALEGDVPRLRQLFLDQQREPASNEPAAEAVQPSDPQQLQAKVEDLIATLLSEMLKLPPHRIEVDVPIEQYGVDSVSMMKLTGELEKVFGPLPKTLFFEYPSIDAVGAYFVDTFPQQLTAMIEPTPAIVEKQEAVAEQPEAAKAAVTESAVQTGLYDVAVIGMSGRFPQANDLDRFWQNLAVGKDCITEIPEQRWDHRQYFDPDRTKPGKSYCKWGGFLDDVAGFDPLFFKISPREAELLDPQERLFLETVWNLLESAGYQGETLQRLCQSRVGVFAGSMTQQYHAFESDLVRESVVALSSHSSIANRVSYFFNFQGPSIAIDTMCSSALVAVHMACDSLLKGECKIAVAGGVNLTIHPKKYIGLSAGQIIGSHPDSTSFGDGDGYLPAEAVGAVLLKPLKDAIADNDNILAVIKSTAINHCGQSNGYSVPSASAQADLIAGNFARAGIDPRTVSYVESAANGSPLGDAIELSALTAGFRKYTDERQFCAIGAVKSNIGHAEAASGMSQLIKVLLQLQHRQLAPTIKAQPLNPNISFEQTPFHLQRRLEQWHRPEVALDGGQRREYPRRATVSSFGAGGSNAHLIVEEYQAVRQQSRETGAPQLMLFSAKTAVQLRAVVRQMLAFIGQQPELSLANLAYTLQTGREAMEYRMALVVDGREPLIQGLRAYLQSSEAAENIFTGDHEQDNSDVRQLLSGKTGQSMLQILLAEKDLEKLALYWVKGVKIAWQGMYHGETLSRIALPTYPFERKSYWLGGKTVSGDAPLPASDSDMPFVIDTQQSMRDNMERYLAHSLSRSLDIPGNDISMSKSLQDYGVDSMFSIKLQRGFEQVFGVKLSARDLSTHATLASLAEFGEAQQVKKNGSELASEDTASKPQPAMSPLSEGQKGLWLLHQLAPQMSAYNIPVALRFRSGLDIGLFRRACELMLQRYPVLGSVFRRHNGELFQTLPSDARLCFTHENSDAEVIELFREKSKQPFDLERGPLFRVHLLSPVSAADSYVLITVHHIVFDGSSAVLLVKALLDTYRQLLAGTEPEYTQETGYNDFVRWQQHFMAGEQAQMQLDYWKARLSGELPSLSLPCDYLRPAEQRFNGASYELALASDLTEKIRELAKSLRVNLSVLFLGVLNMLLHRYSGDDDILVGMPTSGRPESRFDDVVGYFINMIVIRSRVSGRQSVAEFLSELQLIVADGLDNADYPFPALLKELKAGRDQSRSPLFQVMYAYQNFIQPDDLTDLHGGAQSPLPIEFLSGINQEGSHDLALEVYQGKENFQLKLDYNTDLFSADTIRRAMAHYINLLRSITSSPDTAIAEHALLSEDEKQRIVFDWNADAPEYASSRSIVELFQRQAQLTPDNTALLFEHQPLSYRELDLYSSKLANYLLDQGVAAGDPVGVCMGRGLQMVAAMLAVFKAGAVYVPIAPDYPEQRIRHLLDDSKTKLLMTEAKLRGNIQALASACICVAVDQVWNEILASAADLTPQISPEQAAYVIYTSGSTGLPKGVTIAHGAISHHCQVMRDYYRLTPEDKVLQFASVNVDASLEQLLPGLLTGATVVIRPDELWSPQAFRNNVLELGISVADVPPSYLYELLLDTRTDAEWAALRPLRLVITGGEALTPETLSLWRSSPLRGCRLVNAYGPTETTITSTVFETGAKTPESAIAVNIPIGRPLAGESAYILDAYGQPVPVGVPGELHIGGAGLAIGYLNQPELTRQKFIDNPVNPGSLVYKTGDLARWLDDGTIAFLGRLDHQVKIRGFRVECGEIEAALQDLDSVRQAVVLARPVNGTTQLVAFIVPTEDQNPLSSADLKQALAARLPDYMIPAVFVPLAQIPVTPGGKVDRAALMQLDSGSVENRCHVAPRTETEAQLAEIWRQLLNVERVGVHDNFFDLGGHSLLSVRLMAVIHKKLGQELPLSSLFQAPDIAGQAKLLQQKRQPWTPLVCLQPNGDMAPLFCIHAVAGNVLCYQELSRHIGRQRPFYGLQAPDIDSGAHPGCIEELAALYIAAIRSVQAQGPYHLGGWSMGGVIAYEMAGQLQQAGEQVGTLALIESYTPEAVQAFERDYLDKNLLPGDDGETLLLMMFARELGLDDAEAMPDQATAASGLTRRLNALFNQAKHAGLLPEDIDSAQLHRLFSVFEANVRAMNRYVPGQYRGDVRLLHAGSANQEYANGGWAELINGDLSIEAVPGDHYSILRQPNVQFLADKWGDYVNKKTG
ncbi:amino acid adenylation domain-containing protein [Methylobacter sp. Wu8]|uniref:amino acid adenylation domain-containing protein n=1 Tax=Methylobacter sp. Wu8 TaxID=3118457 RepID=UPI002F2C2A76